MNSQKYAGKLIWQFDSLPFACIATKLALFQTVQEDTIRRGDGIVRTAGFAVLLPRICNLHSLSLSLVMHGMILYLQYNAVSLAISYLELENSHYGLLL